MTKVNIYRVLGSTLITLWGVGFIIHLSLSHNFQNFLNNPSGEFIPSVYGLLSAVTINPFVWAGVLFHWRADKNERPDVSSRWLSVIKIYGAITTVIFLIVIYFIMKPNASQNNKSEVQSSSVSSNSSNNFSSDEILRFREIIKEVMRDENMPTPQVHQEFWNLLYKAKFTDSDIAHLKDTMTGDSTIYMKYFYEDALVSVKEGKAFKSAQREDYEKKLLSIGGITELKIKDNDIIIAQIAEGKPVKQDANSEIILTKEMIEAILANLNKVGQRIDELFTK